MPVNTVASLRGRTVLVGGATGELGAAVLARLVALGAAVGVPVRKPWQVEKVRASCLTAKALVGVVGPVDGEAAAGFAKGVHDALGPIDALITTQGAFQMVEAGRDAAGDMQALFEANVFAPLTLARAVVGPMKRRRAGAIVFTGAAAVGEVVPGMSLYLAAKSALHAAAASWHAELSGQGVRVAVVAPGILDTAANREAMPTADRSAWLPLDHVVEALITAAFGTPVAAGPLFRVQGGG